MNLFECCRKCTTDRHPGCHSACERYLEARAKLDEINAVKSAEGECRSYAIEGVIRNKKKNFRKRKVWIDRT